MCRLVYGDDEMSCEIERARGMCCNGKLDRGRTAGMHHDGAAALELDGHQIAGQGGIDRRAGAVGRRLRQARQSIHLVRSMTRRASSAGMARADEVNLLTEHFSVASALDNDRMIV